MDGTQFVGDSNRLWYDSITNTIRVHTGDPGGKIVSAAGFVGSQGIAGPQGFTGSQGAGFTGSQGIAGFTGSQGPASVVYYGQISSQTSQTVSIATQNVYVPMNITGVFDSANSAGTAGNGFGIQNVSGATQLFYVAATADVSVGNNRTTGLQLAINSTAVPESTCTATTGTQDFAKLFAQWMVSLNSGDTVSCLLANLTSDQDITVQRAKLVATPVV